MSRTMLFLASQVYTNIWLHLTPEYNAINARRIVTIARVCIPESCDSTFQSQTSLLSLDQRL